MRTNQRSFAGGELSPELHGRIDLAKYAVGLKKCQNAIVLPHGPVANRPGLQYVGETGGSTDVTRLIEFQFNTLQTYVLVFTHNKFRIIQNGGYVLDPSTSAIVEVSTPYNSADLMELHYVQSGDVITITHHNYAPMELSRTDHHLWSLSAISFEPDSTAPGGVSASATINVAGTQTTYSYVVTAINDTSDDESIASSSASCSGRLGYDDNYNTITWTAVSNTTRYKVYKNNRSGSYGYIGTAVGTSFVDDNIAPDLSITPPISDPPFQSTNNYPAEVNYFQQRRWFANTLNEPQKLWATQSGTESNMATSFPLQENDAMSFSIASRQVNEIRHLVALSSIIALTSGAEWSISPSGSSALTPLSISAKPQSYNGASHVMPIVSGNQVLYVDSKGGRVRDIGYSLESDGYMGRDVSILANHLVDGHTIIDWAYEKVPQSIIWAVREDGKMLGLTYLQEEEVFGWHIHESKNGLFKSVSVVQEGLEDVVYVTVERVIGGVTKQFVERMASRQVDALSDAFFVDSGLIYSGAETSTISGLDHLEGQTVKILGDGNVFPDQVVTSGQITLGQPVSYAVIGLGITADIETLPYTYEKAEAGAVSFKKSVSRVFFKVHNSRGIFVGPSFDDLTEVKQRTTENYGEPISLYTGEVEILSALSWDAEATICVRQEDPLPLMILGITSDVEIGG
ncbi:MAG: hypothetical protein DSZ27_08390 [Thiomicrospira sp.]|nr:MAG: hypothetical protein DSZ27_08390 [Thiomicrospira sp.]